jgi:hypothetical protein
MARVPRHQLMRRPIAIQAGLTGALTKDVALNLDRAILVGLSEQFSLIASHARGWRVRALPHFFVEPIVAEFVEDCLGLCAARHHHTTTASVCTVAATKRARCSPKSTAVSLRGSTLAI